MTVLKSLKWEEADLRFFSITKTHSANGGQASKGMIMLGLKEWVKRKWYFNGQELSTHSFSGLEVRPQLPSAFKQFLLSSPKNKRNSQAPLRSQGP